MKKLIVLLIGLIASISVAQTTSPTTASPSFQPNSGKDNGQRFQEIKQKHLERLGKRISKLQQMQSCVQAANDVQALRACRPERRD